MYRIYKHRLEGQTLGTLVASKLNLKQANKIYWKSPSLYEIVREEKKKKTKRKKEEKS